MLTRRIYALSLILSALVSAPVLAEDYALVACTLDAKGRLLASIVETSNVHSNQRNTMGTDLVGRPCAEAVGRLMDSGFELVGRTPITLCETGPCPNPPPPPPPPPRPNPTPTPLPDCLIWDIAGAAPPGFGLVACNVSAADGPTITMVQTDGQPADELLANGKGMSCADFMSEFMASGGRVLGRSVVPFETLKKLRLNQRRPNTRHFETLNNSILFELSTMD